MKLTKNLVIILSTRCSVKKKNCANVHIDMTTPRSSFRIRLQFEYPCKNASVKKNTILTVFQS